MKLLCSVFLLLYKDSFLRAIETFFKDKAALTEITAFDLNARAAVLLKVLRAVSELPFKSMCAIVCDRIIFVFLIRKNFTFVRCD